MAFKASASASTSTSYASTSQESVVASKELLFVLNTLNEKQNKKQQHYHQHPNLLKQELPVVAESQSRKHMELSQIELIYRAEGNANLVLALPQFKKVLRLPKIQQQQEWQEQQQVEQEPQCQEIQLQRQYGQQQEQQMQQQQQDAKDQQEPNQILTTGRQQNKNAVGILTMDHYVAYISIIRCLVGNEFVFEADIVAVPNPNDRHWINEHIKPYRPANRLDKEFGGHFGLLLPDATQLPAEFDTLFSNEQCNMTTTASKTSHSSGSSGGGSNNNIVVTCSSNNIFGTDIYAIEIKPKQGWLLPNDVNNLFDIKPKETIPTPAVTATVTTTGTTTSLSKTETTSKAATTTKTLVATTDMRSFTTSTQNKPVQIKTTETTTAVPITVAMTSENDKTTHSLYDKVDTRCRYCCMQFLKMQQQKIKKRSNYCPLDLFSGKTERMFNALQSLFDCPQNNLRIFKNGQLILDDRLSETLNIADLFSSEKLQLLKQLLVTCLLREYGNERQRTYDERRQKQQQGMITTQNAEIVGEREWMSADSSDCVAGVADGEPQPSVTSCKKQKLNTNPKITATTTATFTTTTTTAAGPTTTTIAITETEVTKVKSTLTSTKPISATSTSISTSTPVSYDTHSLEQIIKAEVTCLPRNCVLQKLLNLQLLAKINLQFMLDHGYGNKKAKTYSILNKLLEKFAKNHNELTFWQLTPEEQYILAATALDCSIMITFCEIENVSVKKAECPIESLIDNPFVVHLGGKTFLTKVTLLDLDPKPDTHFRKYCQQTKQILDTIKML